MRRLLLNFAFATDVVLVVVLSLTWATSCTVGYTGVRVRGGRALVLDTCRGEVSFWFAPVAIGEGDEAAGWHQMLYDRNTAATTEEWYLASKSADKWGLFALGFGYLRAADLVEPVGNRVRPGRFARGIVIPYWFACALLAIWPVRRAARQYLAERADARQRRGLCPRCGYDMRATPDRCPECGTAGSPATVAPL